MTYQVLYFTRSGNSKRVAQKIAAKLSTDAIEITDNMNWKGPFGFIKGGMYASRNKTVKIEIKQDFADTGELVLVTPLWAGKIAPAINTFLRNKDLDRIHLVVTSGGSLLNARSGYKSVTDVVKKNHNEDAVITDLVNKLL